MTADSERDAQRRGFTRRSFLGTIVLGLAAVGGTGLLFRNIFSRGGRQKTDPAEEFPGPDSIYHPRKDVLERRRRGG